MTIHIENTPNNEDGLPTVLYDNLFAKGTLGKSTEDTNYPVVNITDEATTKYWKPTALPAYVSVDMTTATSADSCAIIGHDLGSKSCSVKVQKSDNNSTWTDVTTAISPTDDTTILLLFKSVSARYWRIYITGSGSKPYVAYVMLGDRFTFPAGVLPPYTPVWLSQKYELLTSVTIGGQFQGNRVLRQGGSTSINLVAVDRTFGEETVLPFRNHFNLGKSFVWASGPSIFDKDVGYCWRTENSQITPTYDNDGIWMSLGMEVYAYGE